MPSPQTVGDGTPDEGVMQAVREQTHLLLGRTISYSDEDWAQPSRLPGWTRSHVAAHLVTNARELVGVCDEVARGNRTARTTRRSAQETAHALELGALADGLSLQIDLDTSAGELDEALSCPAPADARVVLRSGEELPVDQLPLLRLHEVALHSFDLTPDVDELALDPEVANKLLAFRVARTPAHELPGAHIVSHEGFDHGPSGSAPRVTGPAADLLIWLARGVVTPRVAGA
ncbi:maleylpyruvate isomerase family mycothiol-dependent enzyme [Tessaracoccus sp. OS52]|uniref:maleylpyruvate isomerase family mycothiol-dependent enzyme n=1 Tax=Tessaracoccus sp. OS52 TaxID=2886691 RepID=UPI001D11871F|nr:maleylpyruvate isomerase family mycothiol-dependent enzyme [Tessaracoccus sp. OS52]MCC2593366.1 maleylpyruvate isomerase family mycothiol-dependent enzyme [Tessaracoccus sp. OS52]